MADVKWIKIDANIFDNRKIKRLRRIDPGGRYIVVWFYLLTLAGKCNEGGKISIAEDFPYSASDIADDLRIDGNTVEDALEEMEKLEMIYFDDGFIYVSDWENHQSTTELDRYREQARERQRRHRAKLQQAVGDVCVYCGEHADTKDHVIPLSKGGADDLDNLVPSCLACNMEKTNDTLENFLNRRLVMDEYVDIKGIEENEKLNRYVTFDRDKKLFVTRDTSRQSVTSHGTDKIREDKKEIREDKNTDKAPAKPAPVRHRYGKYENVLLSDEELEKVKTEFPDDWQDRIEKMSEYMASNGKSYKNYLAAIRNWKRMEDERGYSGKSAAGNQGKTGTDEGRVFGILI